MMSDQILTINPGQVNQPREMGGLFRLIKENKKLKAEIRALKEELAKPEAICKAAPAGVSTTGPEPNPTTSKKEKS